MDQKILDFSLSFILCRLFRRVLNIQAYEDFSFSLMISFLIVLWSENILCKISVF